MPGHTVPSCQFIKRTLPFLLAATVSVFSSAGLATTSNEAILQPIPLMSEQARTQLEEEIVVHTETWIRACCKNFEMPLPQSISVRLDPATERVVVDLGAELGPYSTGGEMEEFTDMIRNGIYFYFHDRIKFKAVEFRFGGKDMYDYNPQDRPPPYEPDGKGMIDLDSPAKVVVAGGHGMYFNYQFNDWRAQRDVHNGILEDVLTQEYATTLLEHFRSRGSAVLFNPRPFYLETHQPSGSAWIKVAARYHLERDFPDHPEIWNSSPGGNDSMREYKQDIRSRPLYANHIGADAVIHLHTNGHTNPTIRGARAVYFEGRPESQRLAANLLCYMGESIHTLETFKDFRVEDEPLVGRHGENGYARMPSAIVEVGFHTNASDAEALKNPLFRDAAMRGVEKGFRLFRQGKGCETFGIEGIPDVSGLENEDVPVEIAFSGNPRFPVTKVTRTIECPPGWWCNSSRTKFADEVPSPLKYNTGCASAHETAVFRMATKLVDADGVETNEFQHTFTCIDRPKGATSEQAATDFRGSI